MAFDAAVFLSFWLLGGFALLDDLVRGAGASEIATGLLFFGVIALADQAPRGQRTLESAPWPRRDVKQLERQRRILRVAPLGLGYWFPPRSSEGLVDCRTPRASVAPSRRRPAPRSSSLPVVP